MRIFEENIERELGLIGDPVVAEALEVSAEQRIAALGQGIDVLMAVIEDSNDRKKKV